MAHSIFDLFKVGIALLKLHMATLMVTNRFFEQLIKSSAISVVSNIQFNLDISLALITKRHFVNIFDSSAQIADRSNLNEILSLLKNSEASINSPICGHSSGATKCHSKSNTNISFSEFFLSQPNNAVIC
jgi:hypothetical protein